MSAVTEQTPPAVEHAPSRMTFLSGLRVVIGLELHQRVRGVGWYVLLGVFTLLVAIVTGALYVAFGSGAEDNYAGNIIFSVIVFFVLLLGTLVTPALSGNAINGDREAGTLATTQVTLLSTWQIVLGKFLASWASALVFLLAAAPFLVFAAVISERNRLDTIAVSLLMLAVELGVISAIGVGLSGILTKPIFSIVMAYLMVAVLSIGSLIAFGLLGAVDQSSVTTTYTNQMYDPDVTYDENGQPIDIETGEPAVVRCSAPVEEQHSVPRFDHYWVLLTLNPYALVADAVPTGYMDDGNINDLFGTIKLGLRSVQIDPTLEDRSYDACDMAQWNSTDTPTPEEIITSGIPGWFVGLILHLALAVGALWWAWARTRTPARRLAKGSRIA